MSQNTNKDLFNNDNITNLREKYGVIEPRSNDEEPEIEKNMKKKIDLPFKKKKTDAVESDKQEEDVQANSEPELVEEPDIVPFVPQNPVQQKDFTTPSMRIIYQDSDSDHIQPVQPSPAVTEPTEQKPESVKTDTDEVFPFAAKQVEKKENIEIQQEHDVSVKPKEHPAFIDEDQVAENKSEPTEWAQPQPEAQTPGLFKQLLMETFPWKGDSAGEVLRKMIMLTAVLILIGCSAYFGDRFAQARESENLNAELIGMVTQGSGDENFWNDMRKKYPNVVFPQGLLPKFAELYAINPDFAGWIKIQNTDIDIPLLQGEDNSKYLKMDYYGNTTRYGNPFLDYRNNLVNLDRNTIVYGHYMRDGKLFSKLKKYTTIDGYKEAPVIEFSTPTKDYKWKVYAVYITNGFASGDNGYVFNYIFTNLSSDEKFLEYISEIDQRKLYTTGVDILPSDKILTLSTCNFTFDEARLVVVARMLREGESEAVETYKVLVNPNPRYPQAWYDKKGLTNPFKNYSKWTPD